MRVGVVGGKISLVVVSVESFTVDKEESEVSLASGWTDPSGHSFSISWYERITVFCPSPTCCSLGSFFSVLVRRELLFFVVFGEN